MARLQLLIPLMLWLTWLGGPREVRELGVVEPLLGVPIFLLSLAAIVLFARRRARRTMELTNSGTGDELSRYHATLFALRWLLLTLHGGALFFLGWGDAIAAVSGPMIQQVATVPAMVAILPVMLAWVGLAWAQFPLDRAVRERNILWAFDTDQPLRPVPTMGAHLANTVRTHVLVTILPVAAVMILRDALHFALIQTSLSEQAVGVITTLVPISVVVLLAPELLRRIFPTESLPPSPLRDRLEQLCRRLRLRYRDILLWHTHHAIGNAAVMGLVPQVRYVLLSDLILETMDERQIEAVFAHEAGHVKHRHLTWFFVFAITALSCLDLMGVGISYIWPTEWMPAWLPIEAVVTVLWLGLFFLALGALSRQFERQADLFAARSVADAEAELLPDDLSRRCPLLGVEVFNSALIHVARINNMPLDGGAYPIHGGRLRRWVARVIHHLTAWRHGSIHSRIEHLQELAHDPSRAIQFDRRMIMLRVALLISFIAVSVWTIDGYIAVFSRP